MTRLRLLLLLAAVLGHGAAVAQMSTQLSDFRSTLDAAVMYDAPTLRAKKLFVVPRHYPVEVLVTIDHWVRVRDTAGDLAWMEAASRGDKRYVVALANGADLRDRPDEQALVVARARSGVILELLGAAAPGWLRVRHRDGTSGYVRLSKVWGG